MGMSHNQRDSAKLVGRIHASVTPESVAGVDTIRAAALAMFTEHLDAKLREVQDGETIRLAFRVDVVPEEVDSRNSAEYANWRTAVYERDGYTCQECGATSGLNAHHVKAWAHFPESRFDIDNGLTLCAGCHGKRHPHIGMMQRGETYEA